MSGENKELDKKINELKSQIESEDKGFNNKIKKNPKVALAVGSLILAALVIGMIATFGGVGLINGEILGKVILTGLTAGTGIYMADKMTGGNLSNKIDDWFGDSDKKSLNKLERSQANLKRLDLEKDLDKANQGVVEKKIENLIKKGKIKLKDDKIVDQPSWLLGFGKKFDQKEIEGVIEKLDNNKQTTDLKTVLAVSLGLNFEKEEDVRELFNKIKDYATNVSGADNPQDKLKEIFQIALGVNENGKNDFNKMNAISVKDRAEILKELTDAVSIVNVETAKNKAAAAGGAAVPQVKIEATKIDVIKKLLDNAIGRKKENTTGRSVN